MSLTAPTRRLPIRCLYAPPPSTRIPLSLQQRRKASSDSKDTDGPNTVLEDSREKQLQHEQTLQGGPALAEGLGSKGDISSSSIFEDERRARIQKERDSEEGTKRVGTMVRDPKTMARVLDPDPKSRERWERKQVIKMVQNRGRLSKEEFIKRTEREHLAKSPNFKTSVKKLGMLARQIAGKTVDDAIVQMQFSKKKAARDVLAQLEAARDEAIITRGMGLGNVARAEEQEGSTPRKDRALDIRLKNGKRYSVTDRTKIYIDQAWVGRGPYGRLPDYRARGQMNIMRTPWTSLSLVLKEEKTRVREYEEREAKRQRQLKENLWTAMPDRPIQIQRQWYSW